MSDTNAQSLSIVVTVRAGRDYLARCLEALEKQRGAELLEILVAHDGTLRDVAALQRRFQDVRFLGLDGRRSPAELRAAGVRAARGDVVALTEDDCSPKPGWAHALLELHQGGWAAVGGPVDKRGPDTPLNWAIYLSDFGRYMSPPVEGEDRELAGANVAYKRAALEGVARLWQKEFDDVAVQQALRGRGEGLLLSRRAPVRQQRSLRLASALSERYRAARLLAADRAAGAALPRRVLRAAASTLLSVAEPVRACGDVVRTRRFDTPFLRLAPALLLLGLARGWGEMLGHLTGRALPRPRAGSAARASTATALARGA